jgi:predicted Zn finger-like uncharacterized protein
MKARCPQCKFIYNISSNILKEANFKVVCAECHNVFKVAGNQLTPNEDIDNPIRQEPGGKSAKAPEARNLLADLQQSLDKLDIEESHDQPETEILEDLDTSLIEPAPTVSPSLPDTVFASEPGQEFEEDSYLFMSEPASEQDDSLLTDTLFASELEDISNPVIKHAGEEESFDDQPETLFAEDLDDMASESQLTDNLKPEDESLQPAFMESRKTTSVLAVIFLIVLVFTALVQFAWIEKERFLQFSFFHAAATSLCPYIGCTLPGPEKTAEFTIVDRSLQPDSHPGSYRLDILLRNDSKMTQSLPALRLSLLDNRQITIAQRTFSGKSYIGPATISKRLKPGEILEIHLQLSTPEKEVSGFKLDFVPAA